MNIRRKILSIQRTLAVILVFAAATSFCFSFFACTALDDYDIDALIQSRANNVVRIRAAGASESSGTGTLVDMYYYAPLSEYHGIIITCYHVVIGQHLIEVAFNDNAEYFRKYAMRIGYDIEYDIAIFETTFALESCFTDTLELVSGNTLVEGQRVLTFGDAHGNGVLTSKGSIDGVNVAGNVGGIIGREMTLIRVTSSIVTGKSGGPTFDMQGRLIGINIGTRGGKGYLVPADRVKIVFDRVMAER